MVAAKKVRIIKKSLLVPGMAFLFILCSCNRSDIIDLQGEWTYRLDTAGQGKKEKWYTADFQDKILLPGAMRDYGIGEDPSLTTDWTGSIYDSSWYFNPATKKYRERAMFPFWLTPVKHYKGIAWYQKEIEVPATWEGRSLLLTLERPHWQTSVWLDSILLGSENSLSTPHRYKIPGDVARKGKHRLTVRVDNAIRELDPGINSHSISDHTQGNWNGIIGEMNLRISPTCSIANIILTPDLEGKQVHARVIIAAEGDQGPDEIDIKISGVNHSHNVQPVKKIIQKDEVEIEVVIPMGKEMKTWSEFTPDYYMADIEILHQGVILDTKSEVFGMREFTIDSLRFAINGTPVFLRGTTECSVFPLTGYPPTDEAAWDRIFGICKSFGLNHMRFHSYCPPEAAFNAADRAGIYLQVECPSWAKYSTALGYGEPIDKYLMDETKRIIDEYGNHPSFVMMAYGNEPSGRYVGYLENWVDYFRHYDSRILYTGASTGRSWAIIDNSDFIVRSPPRGLNWKDEEPGSEFDYRYNTESQQRPYVSFEMGQWCVFPNFNEIDKYTGSLEPRNLMMFREDLSDKGMAFLSEKFLMASGKLQASCYKQEIEATLRTPNLAGFQLLSLNDFPGQGTALVGVLDAFWDEKGYISADEFKRFCAPLVPLVRLPAYTFFTTDTLQAGIEVANFTGETIEELVTQWRLKKPDASIFATGEIISKNVEVGNTRKIGEIEIPLSGLADASSLTLEVDMNGAENSWNIWVYPDEFENDNQGNILVVSEITPDVEEKLLLGAKVLLLAGGTVQHGSDVVHYQTPVFWNTSWFRMRPPHTTGMLISEEHPVFRNFPTESYTDQQWWELSNRQQVMNLDSFPAGFASIVQPIDTWFLNRKLSFLFEARVGKGKLMVCSMDLTGDPGNRKVADYFYHCLLDYMNSADFIPIQSVEIDDVKEIFEVKDRPGWNSYVNANP